MKIISGIAKAAYIELYRAKIIITLVFFFILMLLLGTFFGTVSVGDKVKIIKDFGLFCISSFSIGFIIISGTSLLQKELQKKTIYNILSKPISRGSLIIGKYVGMVSVATVLIAILSFLFLLYVWFFQRSFDQPLISGIIHMVLEGAIVAAAALFFSSIVTTPLFAGLFTAGIFIAGRNLDALSYFIASTESNQTTRLLSTCLYWVLPHLHQISILNRVVYGQMPPLSYTMWCAAYSAGYVGILLMFSFVFFNKREFN